MTQDGDILKVLIVRHGQTAHNSNHILQGHLNTDLNERGQKEASLAGSRLRASSLQIDGIWSSDLNRCRQTLQGMLKSADWEQSVGNIEFWKELRERSMGDLEGMKVKEARQKCLNEGTHFHDYGESRHHAVARLNGAFDKVVETSLARDYKSVMIISHGGVISKFIAHLINDKGFAFSEKVDEKDIKVPPNTSFTSVVINKQTRSGVVEMFGDANHLQGLNLINSDEV